MWAEGRRPCRDFWPGRAQRGLFTAPWLPYQSHQLCQIHDPDSDTSVHVSELQFCLNSVKCECPGPAGYQGRVDLSFLKVGGSKYRLLPASSAGMRSRPVLSGPVSSLSWGLGCPSLSPGSRKLLPSGLQPGKWQGVGGGGQSL